MPEEQSPSRPPYSQPAPWRVATCQMPTELQSVCYAIFSLLLFFFLFLVRLESEEEPGIINQIYQIVGYKRQQKTPWLPHVLQRNKPASQSWKPAFSSHASADKSATFVPASGDGSFRSY
mgnify:CR=1 FL=1